LKQVLFDSDVLLDILAQRQPFVVASAQAIVRNANLITCNSDLNWEWCVTLSLTHPTFAIYLI